MQWQSMQKRDIHGKQVLHVAVFLQASEVEIERRRKPMEEIAVSFIESGLNLECVASATGLRLARVRQLQSQLRPGRYLRHWQTTGAIRP